MGGLYTDEQLEALQQQTSRGDAVDSIANHLAARIVETKHSFFSYTTQLNQQLQHDLERATTPFPYSMINWIPSWCRATLSVLFIALIIGIFARPLYSALLCIRNDYISFIDFLHTIFCGHAAPLRAVRAHNHLASRFDAVNGAEENQHNPAMVPLIDEPRLRTRITTLQRQLDELQSSHNALEKVVKDQAIFSKQLEARLNRAEQTQPPPYTNISALTKDSAARKR